MWIQTDSNGIVKRQSATQCSSRPGAIDYEVASIPATEEGESLLYDGTDFTVNPNYEARKAKLEPSLIAAYRKWQDAITLDLPCIGDCEAAYLGIKAQYDALVG
jgi:hypothetical protein